MFQVQIFILIMGTDLFSLRSASQNNDLMLAVDDLRIVCQARLEPITVFSKREIYHALSSGVMAHGGVKSSIY